MSPYTQKEYPLTFFEGEPEPEVKEEVPKAETESTTEDAKKEDAVAATESEDDDGPEFISLEDADAEMGDESGDDEEIPDIPDIPDVEDDDDDSSEDDTFLETDDEDDDLSDVIVGVEGKDDES